MWRGGVTIGGAMAALGLTHIGLPGVDMDEVAAQLGPFSNGNMAVGALGITPLLAAGSLVEIASLFRPARRGRRPADFAARVRLVYIVTLILALLQAIAVAVTLRRLDLQLHPESSYQIIIALLGGVFCHVALARVIDDQGLGSGILIVFLCNALGDLPDLVARGMPVAPSLAAFTVAFSAAFFVLKPAAPSAPARVPLLTAGLLPFAVAAYAVPLVLSAPTSTSIAELVASLESGVGASSEATGGHELHSAAVLVGLTAMTIVVASIAGSWLVTAPNALSSLWARATAAGDGASWQQHVRPALWLGVALSAGLSLALSLLDLGAGLLESSAGLASAGALAAAALLDIRRSSQASEADTPVWVDTRIAWLAPIREALSRADISSVTRGETASMLLPLNGPLFASQILVPARDAERASQIIVELLASPTGIVAIPSRRAPEVEPPVLPKRPLVAAFAAVLIGAAMVAWPTAQVVSEKLQPPPVGEPATLAFLLVDDHTDPLERWGSGNFTAPDGIEVRRENAPLGEGRGTATRAFATTQVSDGESTKQAADRLLAFLATIEIPRQRRWALEATADPPGWRSFLLETSTPGPTHDDLRDVAVTPDEHDPLRLILRLELTAQGGRLFEEITAANVKRRFAIVVNDTIESAPVINQRISGGSLVITMGDATKEEAFALRDALQRSIRKR
jgi:hypothetical protein